MRNSSRGVDGKDGRDGFSPDHLELAYDGEAGELVMCMRAFDRMVERRLPLPMLRDAGLWCANKRYRQGHVVTYGGSAFVAVRDTFAPIGSRPPSPDWRLLVQRGRDA